MIPDNIDLITRVLTEYYELGYTQSEISYKEHISKSSVSRIIQKAKEDHYVTFQLNLPCESLYELEEEFKECFSLPSVHIIPSPVDDLNLRFQNTTKALCSYLNELLADDDIIGVSWGSTMERLSRNLVPCKPPRHNLKVVQLCGSLAKNFQSSKSYTIVENFASNYLCTSYMLPAPAIVDTVSIAQALCSDSQIREVLDASVKARIAVFGIGALSMRSVILESGTLSPAQYEYLSQHSAVCDVLFHFLDIEGNIVSRELDQRTIGIRLDYLRKKEHRIAVAVGEWKAKAIISALHAGIINILFIDELTARKTLDEYHRCFS